MPWRPSSPRPGSAGSRSIGEVGDEADLGPAAAAARAAGLDALATESERHGDGLPRSCASVDASLAGVSPGGFLGVTGNPWPGTEDRAPWAPTTPWTGPTGPPWIDSNAWYVRLARELVQPRTTWLSFDPPEDEPSLTAAAYEQAVADTAVYGAAGWSPWTVGCGLDLSSGRAEARDTWGRDRPQPLLLRGAPDLGRLPSRRAPRGDLRLRRRQRVHLLRGGEPAQPVGTSSTASSRRTGPGRLLRRAGHGPLSRRDPAGAGARSGSCTPSPRRVEPWSRPPGGRSGARARRPRPTPASASPGRKGRVAVAREDLVDPFFVVEGVFGLTRHADDRLRVFNPGVSQFHYVDERGRALGRAPRAAPLPSGLRDADDGLVPTPVGVGPPVGSGRGGAGAGEREAKVDRAWSSTCRRCRYTARSRSPR